MDFDELGYVEFTRGMICVNMFEMTVIVSGTGYQRILRIPQVTEQAY